MRQRELHLEGCIRENRGLAGTLEIVQQAQNELFHENNLLKEQSSEIERQKMIMKSNLEKQEREIGTQRQKVAHLA